MSSAVIADPRKIITEKSGPQNDIGPDVLTITPQIPTLFGTRILGAKEFPAVFSRYAQISISPTSTDHQSIIQLKVTSDWILKNVSNPEIFQQNYIYFNGCAIFKFLLKGHPLYGGAIRTTFNPCPRYMLDSDFKDTLDTEAYSKGYDMRYFEFNQANLWEDSVSQVIVPFCVPTQALRTNIQNVGIPLGSDASNANQNYPIGTIDVRHLGTPRCREAEATRPTLTIFSAAIITYGGSNYVGSGETPYNQTQ